MRVRTRIETVPPLYGSRRYFGSPSSYFDPGFSAESICRDVVGNPNGANPLFSLQRRYFVNDATISLRSGTTRILNGKIGIARHALQVSAPYSVQSMQAWSAEGYDRVTQVGDYVDAASTIGEGADSLRNGPLRGRTSRLRALARIWYAKTFGIDPAVSDLHKLLSVEMHRRTSLRKLKEEAAGWQSRRAKLHNDSTTERSEWSSLVSPFGALPLLWGVGVDGKTTLERSDRIWFSTQFRRTIGEGFKTSVEDFLHIRMERRSPNLDTVWELTPYSWVVDYFVPVGAIIQTFKNRDGIAFRYPCIMHESSITKRLSAKVDYPTSSTSRSSATVSATAKVTIKRRIPNPTPLPGLAFSGLSDKQVVNLVFLTV